MRNTKKKQKIKSLNRNAKLNRIAIQVAHDYREQQQRRYGETQTDKFIEALTTHKDAALSHLRKFIPGLTGAQYEQLLREGKAISKTAFDDPIGQLELAEIQQKILAAATRRGLPRPSRVSVGVLHGDGVEAMQQRVMLADASIIMLTAHLSILINRLAKLIALSVPIAIRGDQFDILYESPDFFLLAEQPYLQGMWAKFFIDYAVDSDHPSGGEELIVQGDKRQTIWQDMAQAIKLFVMGHEYGHHIAGHSLDGAIGADGEQQEAQHRKEHEADHIALLLSTEAGQAEDIPNWPALTGCGAVSILLVLELARQGKHTLLTGSAPPAATRGSHPSFDARLTKIQRWTEQLWENKGEDIAIRMQNAYVDLILHAWKPAQAALLNAHKRGVRPNRKDTGGWLP